MRASSLLSNLVKLIPTRQPLFVWGPPGVGKSSIIRQAAKQLNLTVEDVRAVLLDPVDLRGMPSIKDGLATWCIPDFLPKSGSGLLFLDELPQAPHMVQSACLQLVLDRRIGNYVLPDGWVVIAAGNRTKDRAGAHELISSLRSRFIKLDLDVSQTDWQDWAVKHGIRQEIRSFLKFRPGLLVVTEEEAAKNPVAFPCPRTWEFLSNVFGVVSEQEEQTVGPRRQVVEKGALLQVAEGCVGEGAAGEFVEFLNCYSQVPDIQEILKAPKKKHVPEDPSVMCATIGALTDVVRDRFQTKDLKPDTTNNIFTFAGMLLPEYGMHLVQDLARIDDSFCLHHGMEKFIASNAAMFQ
jgi:hypothetical protein